MTLQEFVDYYTKGGEADVTFSGVGTNQCMALMHAYIYLVLDLTDKLILAQPNAYQVYENYNNDPGKGFFQRIANTPTNFPLPGDIVIFNTKVGPSGHVSICISADVNSLTTFDSNWDNDNSIGIKPHIVSHSYTNAADEPEIDGWLHPLPQAPQVTVDEIQQQLKTEVDALTNCQTQLKTESDHNGQLQSQLKDLQSKYDNEHSENSSFISEIATITTDRKNYSDAAELAKSEASQLAEYLDQIAGHTGIDTKGLNDSEITNQINLKFSEMFKQIQDYQKQLSSYNQMKQKASTIVTSLPSSGVKNFLSWIKGLIFVPNS